MAIVFRALPLHRLVRFAAYDPSAGNIASEFVLEEYAMMPEGAVEASASSRFARRAGIRSMSNGSTTMIPEALFELWKLGQIPAERIPQLAYAMSARVNPEDYNLIFQESPKTFASVLGILLGGLLVTMMIFDPGGMPVSGALALSFGLTALIGSILFLVRFTQRRRRRNQMRWLLQVNAGNPDAAPPEGRLAGRLKLYFLLVGWMLLIAAAAGVCVWWFAGRS